jgi:arylsulfatase
MRLFNLRSDPKEETDIKDFNPWVKSVVDQIVADYQDSIEAFPNVPRGAPDPYTPPKRNR